MYCKPSNSSNFFIIINYIVYILYQFSYIFYFIIFLTNYDVLSGDHIK